MNSFNAFRSRLLHMRNTNNDDHNGDDWYYYGNSDPNEH